MACIAVPTTDSRSSLLNTANTVPVMIPGIWTGVSLPAAIATSSRTSRMKPIFAAIQRIEPDLIALAACGHEVVIFQVLDPAELQFNFESAAMFQDMESGRTLFIDPAAARKDYARNIEAHCAALRAVCQRLGIACHRLSTERPLELALFDFLRERMQRRRSATRSNRHSSRSAISTGGSR